MSTMPETPEGQKVVAEFLVRVRERRMRAGARTIAASPTKRAKRVSLQRGNG
jgi:hypothetical protein